MCLPASPPPLDAPRNIGTLALAELYSMFEGLIIKYGLIKKIWKNLKCFDVGLEERKFELVHSL